MAQKRPTKLNSMRRASLDRVRKLLRLNSAPAAPSNKPEETPEETCARVCSPTPDDCWAVGMKGGNTTRESLFRATKVKTKLGNTYIQTSQYKRASRVLGEALRGRLMIFGAENRYVAEVHVLLGDLAIKRDDGYGELATAAKHYELAMRVCELELGLNKEDAAAMQELENLFEKAVLGLESCLPEGPPPE